MVPELELAIRRAESVGARPEGAIQDFPWGRYLVMADPFGNGFCLLQFKGAGYGLLERDQDALEPRHLPWSIS